MEKSVGGGGNWDMRGVYGSCVEIGGRGIDLRVFVELVVLWGRDIFAWFF